MKCKYSKTCELYNEDNLCCNKIAGKYYEDDYCGKYRELENLEGKLPLIKQ